MKTEIQSKTDTQLKADVISELSWEPSINSDHIGVAVNVGIVTLSGHVDSYLEKWNAEQAVKRVSGVRALAVEMDVKLPGSSKRTDSDIASSAENALQWTSYLPKNSIQIMAEGGWVTLSGEVDWGYQRQSAVGVVRHLLGVKGITDNISIKSKVSSTGVKADIAAALKRRAITDVEKISVEVRGDQVTLSGNVDTWSERELARHSAWGTAGVKSVVNNINVV